MIKINLLPLEKRKTERTPLPRFFLILATAATAAVLVLWTAWAYLQVTLVERDIESKKKDVARLAPLVAEHDKLQKRVDELKNKIREIDSVTTRDVDWWRAMSALWDVIHSSPKVWIDDLKVQGEGPAGQELRRVNPESKMNPGPMYVVTLKCHVGGMEVSEMTRFRNELKNNIILQETLPTINFNVDWKVDDEKGFDEKHSISFNITLLGPGAKYVPPAAKPTDPKKPGPAPGTTPTSDPQKAGGPR